MFTIHVQILAALLAQINAISVPDIGINYFRLAPHLNSIEKWSEYFTFQEKKRW